MKEIPTAAGLEKTGTVGPLSIVFLGPQSVLWNHLRREVECWLTHTINIISLLSDPDY